MVTPPSVALLEVAVKPVDVWTSTLSIVAGRLALTVKAIL